MLCLEDKTDLRREIGKIKASGKSIVLVPTMGNLHPGHMSLIAEAKKLAEVVVVSIFVNPLQFGENEDFREYPRTLPADEQKLKEIQVDILFCPDASTMYKDNFRQSTRVEVPGVSDILCGEFRPGFFIGVSTVVAKLFNLVLPDIAVFGQKDYQQLQVIQRMCKELNFPIEIVSAAIVREADGLAMSSRNSYLSSEQRRTAPLLYQSLKQAANDFIAGQAIDDIEKKYKKILANNGFNPDYFVIVDANSLLKPKIQGKVVILTAAWLGTIRLIDNLIIR